MAYWDGTRWVPDTAPTTSERKTDRNRLLGAAAEASVIVLLVFGLVAGTTFAAGKGSGDKHDIAVTDGVFATAHDAWVYGDRSDYWVLAECRQDSTVVYREWVTADAEGRATLMLGPTELWSGGDALCTATAGFYGKNFRWRSVASAQFLASDD